MKPNLGATYRVQLRGEFTFGDAAARLDYLCSLGIETLYCSPVAEAVPGSTHGYDGIDPHHLRGELGGAEAFDELSTACTARGLGLCIDIVPNHLATWSKGPWWRRVLAEGPKSELAPVFDIDWRRGSGGAAKVALPILSVPLGTALEDGTIRLVALDGEIVLMVGDVDLPLNDTGARLEDNPGEVLAEQHYRLVDWHDKADRNYRRFFDIDGLVGLRIEDVDVFDLTHRLVVDLARRGAISALRVDHVDGLREPAVYLERLRRATGLPIVVEKILTGDETLREGWPIEGTTGYEVLDDIGGALVSPSGLGCFVEHGKADGDGEVEEVTRTTRSLVAHSSFPGEIAAIAATLGVKKEALSDTLVRFPVYRTYASSDATTPLAPGDRDALLHAAGSDARDDVLATLADPAHRSDLLAIQQLSGAVMAKGVEDTAWYRLSGPLAFLEVGGDPGRDRRKGVNRLHERAAARALDGRAGLIALTTHDTKRTGDVRARLYGLCERPEHFEEGLARFAEKLSATHDAEAVVDLPRQIRILGATALAVLPPDRGKNAGELHVRVGDALVKGAREAKEHSSWDEPNGPYEAALRRIVDEAFLDDAALVRDSFGELVEECARLGAVLSLSSVVLAGSLPGTPDCYQGDESWNLFLVDPDNRRTVDYDALARTRAAIAELGDPRPGAVAGLRRSWRDGTVKLLVTQRCLAARQAVPDAFRPGAEYLPLRAVGPRADNVIAFLRRGAEGSAILSLSTRSPAALHADGDDLCSGAAYAGTTLELPGDAPRRWRDAIGERHLELEGNHIALTDAFGELPVALLIASLGCQR